MSTRTYTVEGMTCGHCVASVTDEIRQVPGIQDVHVDLAGKTATVTADAFDDDAVRAAVEEAGYTVSGVVAGVSD